MVMTFRPISGPIWRAATHLSSMAGSPGSPITGAITPPSSSIPASMSRSTSCSRIRATSRQQACINHWASPRSIRPSASSSRSTSAAKPACPASTPPATSPTPSRRHRSPWHHRTARWRVSSPSSRWWFSTDSLLRLPRARLSFEVRRALFRRWTESLPMGNAEGPLPDAGEVPVKRSPEMTTLLKIALSAAVVAALSIAQASDAGAQAAQSYEAPPKEANAIFANYRFRNGETLPELRLNYTTLGQPRRNSHGAIDNAVLMLHWTSASGQALLTPEFRTALFAPGAPFDVTRYFVILPDAIGHGRSSKPSDGLRAAFPRYGYGDMVDLQHRLVTEVLGIARLRAIAGISMGCMKAWQWAEAYP